MSVDTRLLEILIDANKNNSCKYTIHLGKQKYPLEDVSIINSPTPVNSPTTRGGVYFSDKFAYKLKGKVGDLSIIPLLSSSMLGPNTEFGKIKITAKMSGIQSQKDFVIYTNLTNSIQRSASIELNMIIINLEDY